MIYRVAPAYGRRNPLVYISICSTVGSVSVMSVKAFGIAVKLTLQGNNQFTHASTYVFMIVTSFCILTQMNYFNKALNQFSTSMCVGRCLQMETMMMILLTSYYQSQPSLLCHLYYRHSLCVVHPVQRLLHDRCSEYHFSVLRLSYHLLGRVPLEPFARRPRWPVTGGQQGG